MRGLEELDHYEILELSRDASAQEIEEAYRILRETYADDSLALYSVFAEGDAGVMRERLEEAYRVLSDLTRRRKYDGGHHDAKEHPPTVLQDEPGESPARPPSELMPLGSSPSLISEIDEPSGGEWGGAMLRRARLQAGLELEEIAEITKIGAPYLQEIEDEAFDSLPAAVYVRGFVTAYARAIGLDPKRVAASYMPRLEAARKEKGRGRLLGHR